MDQYNCYECTIEDATYLGDSLYQNKAIVFPLSDGSGGCYIISIATSFAKHGTFPWGGKCDDEMSFLVSFQRKGASWFDYDNVPIHEGYYSEKLGITISEEIARMLNQIISTFKSLRFC